ncbi:MAG: GGDEF domain-containing protein, partial [Candidatus Acidiferrales bacterium]
RYGHDVGDQVLRMVAAKLAEVGGGGRAFRYGGEEFTILFPGRAVDESLPYLERIRKAVEETRFAVRGPGRPRRKPKKARPNRQSRREASITVSIGVAERDQHNARPEQVLKAADRALYTAKRAGRNRIEPWSH